MLRMFVVSIVLASVLAAAPLRSIAAPSGSLYGQPVRLVHLRDGRTINLICIGQGVPTVLLESGFGAGASAWSQVQPPLATVTRVCGYDRAGYGFSDPGPTPRDGEAVARDLDEALRRAGERGPFVVMGHSAGGLYARLFAARRRGDVVGLVLVDSSVPFQMQRTAAAVGGPTASLEGVRRRPESCLQAAERGSKAALDAAGCLPKDGALARSLASRPAVWRTQLSELDTLFTTTSTQVVRTTPILKETPTIVLTASPTGLPAKSDDPGAAIWQGLHREIAAQFFRGRQRLVRSSHLMMNDRPDVVAGAALELIKGYRAQRR